MEVRDQSKALFSLDKVPTDFTNEGIKSYGQPLSIKRYLEKERKPRHPLLKLNRIRDFISLWLSYPMRSVHDSKLKAWIHEVSNVHGWQEKKHRLLHENPLKYLEGLIPIEMIMEIEAGGDSVFANKNVMPQLILELAADLAVGQLVQTLLSGEDHIRNIHRVMLSTRNGAEQIKVFKKIKMALKDTHNMPGYNEIFHEVLCVDATFYGGEVEILVQQEIHQQLQLQLPSKLNELQGMMSKKYLVLLLDGNTKRTIDPRKVNFSKYIQEVVMVLITNSKQGNDQITMSMDLKISTDDHLLPWEVFCRNVGNELVRSATATQRIAVHMVEECRGQLFAIVLVAKSLKNVEDVKFWELALNKLCYPNPSYDMNMFQGVSRVMVNAFINFVWNDLSETQKHCLTSCLFIPDIRIGKLYNELMYHWISYQLLEDGEAVDNLRKLVERSILLQLQGFKGKYIQLPEDTYAILHSLNTQSPFFIQKSELGLIEPPNDELWHNAVHMELGNNKLSELPLSPHSLELKVLKLQGNADITRIPPLFFFKMPLLCILDLSYTCKRATKLFF